MISAKHFKIKNSCLHNKYDRTRENTTTRETDTSDQRAERAERGDENTEHSDLKKNPNRVAAGKRLAELNKKKKESLKKKTVVILLTHHPAC